MKAMTRKNTLRSGVMYILLFICTLRSPSKTISYCQFVNADEAQVLTEGECTSNVGDSSCVSNTDVIDLEHTAHESDDDEDSADAAPYIDDDSEAPGSSECVDTDERCSEWAFLGECAANPNYMLIYCPISCDSCPEPYEKSPEEEMLLETVAKYGKPQTVEGVDSSKTFDVIRRTVSYMEKVTDDQLVSSAIAAECVNQEPLCSYWAAIGECEANKGYMKVKCAPSCESCDMIDFNNRCPPLAEDVRPGLLPGELNAMFERIVATAPGNNTQEFVSLTEGMTNYTVVVHSRPGQMEGEQVMSRSNDLQQPPWVITFENFLTEEECDHLIKLGYKSEYERSKDVGELQVDGSYGSLESHGRTSENAWCSHAKKCRGDDVATLIHQRIETVTGIPANNSEDFQILKYEPGQYYRRHHDYIEHQENRRCGPRVLTFFLYLSDVEEGGATNFPALNIAIKPQKGRALLWPSVLNSDPKKKDPRTDHEAQDVVKGTKFGANAWLHLHDYLAAADMGCS